VDKVQDIVADIATASQQQSAGLDEINIAVAQLDEMTQRWQVGGRGEAVIISFIGEFKTLLSCIHMTGFFAD
jgi:hypothetical protein